MSSQIILGIGDIGGSDKAGVRLATHALGSCVAVVAHDPIREIWGMVHVALPDSRKGPKEGPGAKTGYYADTGIPALITMMEKLGCNRHGLKIRLIGGASILGSLGSFSIGKRNVLAARKILWRFGLGPTAEDVGGEISRTVRVTIGSGQLEISNPRRGAWSI